MARPTKYDPLFPLLVKHMKINGMTNEQIAVGLQITTSTLYKWQTEKPEFSDSLKTEGDFIDHLVANSLLKRAMGISFEEVKIKKYKDGTETVEITQKYIPPDTGAMIFWLKNRQKDKWKDRWEITGDGGGPIELAMVEFKDKLKDKLKVIEAEIVTDEKEQE